uniref:Reverse transcriptase domain-containing protein n=1 Tax=Nicotiana tabacum TaxID=4097 RepID=A0A1S4DD15_TOBAC|nr:PREDICTED: uncharacterized protein LOC107828514 [Nicotiana tabacum]
MEKKYVKRLIEKWWDVYNDESLILKPCSNTKIIKAGVCLLIQQQQELIQEVTYEEVDEAVKDMPNDKAPGVDGFLVEFFKMHWNEVRQEVYEVVVFFFQTSKMKKAWNCTAITLIPKGPDPTTVKDYRHIACCTTVYKVIAKILTKRIKKKFIGWIMECVTTVSYSLALNGGLTRPFPAKRGIRQGDPMSPYLFVIAMEYLQREMSTLTMQKEFKFHPKCKKLGVTNIYFADDLLMFCRGDKQSVNALQDTFNKFSNASGLQASAEKSSIYTAGVPQHIKEELINLTGTD